MATEELRKIIPVGGLEFELIVLSSVSDDDTVLMGKRTDNPTVIACCYGIGGAPATTNAVSVDLDPASQTITIHDPSGDRTAILVIYAASSAQGLWG